MRHLSRAVSVALALLLLASIPARAQVASEQLQRAGLTPLRDASSTVAPSPTSSAELGRQAPADPVADGITYGALIGAGAAAAMVAVSFATCDGSCSAPEPLPLFLVWTGFGAGVGAVTGWIVDSMRHSTDRRITVSVVPAPKRKAVRVALSF